MAIVDFDVHHGNGTQAMFYDDPAVLFVSSHQYPYYPGTGAAEEVGAGAGAGFTVNLPLEAGAGDADLDEVFRAVAVPILDAFAPGLVLVSAGFDGHASDPLGGFRMTPEGFANLARLIGGVAERHAGGRLVVCDRGRLRHRRPHQLAERGAPCRRRRRLRRRGGGGRPSPRPGQRGRRARGPGALLAALARRRRRWRADRIREPRLAPHSLLVPTSVSDYHPQELDKKWQARWHDSQAFEVVEDPSKPKFYCLEMFAYPSGHAHVGHVRNYIIGDVVARLKRLQGFNVLHPFGWDAFGLPAENAAIKSGIHPETSTLDNIAHMKGQLQRLGISYAWGRELATCLPDYYRWNQWIFTRMFERGLAYRRRSTVNWCPVDNTVLANEQVVDGACWRCGTTVEQKDLEQWFFRITAYADDLLASADELSQWPDKVLTMQRNWIGRSEGARVSFALDGWPGAIEVFTTRIDTIYGATFLMLGPEHPLAGQFADAAPDPQGFKAQLARFRGQDRAGRVSGDVEKEGFFTGHYAVNPFSGERVPVWVANFVLGEYGTGAVMGVPFGDQRDFEFARKYDLPVRAVIAPADGGAAPDVATMTEALPDGRRGWSTPAPATGSPRPRRAGG